MDEDIPALPLLKYLLFILVFLHPTPILRILLLMVDLLLIIILFLFISMKPQKQGLLLFKILEKGLPDQKQPLQNKIISL